MPGFSGSGSQHLWNSNWKQNLLFDGGFPTTYGRLGQSFAKCCSKKCTQTIAQSWRWSGTYLTSKYLYQILVGEWVPETRVPKTRYSGPENFKKSRPKKFVKSHKSISRKHFWPNSFFCNFKIVQKSIFELGKSLKLPEVQYHEKQFLICLISRVFLGGLF